MSIEQMISYNGVHHIALATANLEATIDFYRDVLGMHASDVYPSRAGRGRHCLIFLKPDDDDIWGFHFFERLQAVRAKPASIEGEPKDFLLHIALRLSSEAAACALHERLLQASIAVTDIPELGSFLFPDNNGIYLEATWPKEK